MPVSGISANCIGATGRFLSNSAIGQIDGIMGIKRSIKDGRELPAFMFEQQYPTWELKKGRSLKRRSTSLLQGHCDIAGDALRKCV